jgi:hypothetical protein
MKEIEFNPDQFFVPEPIVDTTWPKTARQDRYVSPYYIPQAMRALYNDNSGLLEIEIEYLIGDDRMQELRLEGVSLWIGKHSGRVYKLAIPVSMDDLRNPMQAVIARLENVMNIMKARQPDNGQRHSYAITGKVLHDRASGALKGLVPA